LTATALLDFDDEVDEDVLYVADPELEAEPEPNPDMLDEGEGVLSANDAFATAWNASKGLFYLGLMMKTIPA